MIRLAIIDNDKLFLNKVSVYFNSKYGNEMSVNTYSRYDLFEAEQAVRRFDIIWGTRELVGLTEKLTKSNNFAYVVDQKNISSIDDVKAICKYQKPDVIYRKMLSIYSELDRAAGIIYGPESGSNAKVIVVNGLAGGIGSSAYSAALSQKLTNNGHRVFYLDVSSFGTANVMFNGEGDFGLSDVFYSIKSKKGNIGLKIKSVVKEDRSKVAYFDTWNSPLDFYNIEHSDVFDLITELVKTNNYDYIVFDTKMDFTKEWIEFLNRVSNIILVGDDSDKCKVNSEKMVNIFDLLEKQEVADLHNRTLVAYNNIINTVPMQNRFGTISNIKHTSNRDMKNLVGYMSKHINLADLRN